MNRRRGLRVAADTILVLGALLACAAAAKKFWGPSKRTAAGSGDSTYVRDWRRIASQGVWRGDTGSKVVLIEFADFQCSTCREYASGLKKLKQEFPGQFAVVFHHWPLEYHRFAGISARSAECAKQQGFFWEMHDLLYEKQDSIGVKPWTEFAAESGVGLDAYRICMQTDSEAEPTETGRLIIRRIGGRGTPSFLINGWFHHGLLTLAEIRTRIVAAVGKRVFVE